MSKLIIIYQKLQSVLLLVSNWVILAVMHLYIRNWSESRWSLPYRAHVYVPAVRLLSQTVLVENEWKSLSYNRRNASTTNISKTLLTKPNVVVVVHTKPVHVLFPIQLRKAGTRTLTNINSPLSLSSNCSPARPTFGPRTPTPSLLLGSNAKDDPGKQLKETWKTRGHKPTLPLCSPDSGYDEAVAYLLVPSHLHLSPNDH